MARLRKNLTGKVYGKLTVLSYRTSGEAGKAGKWKCRCSCGNIKETTASNLTSGCTKSCGCLAKKLASKRLKKLLTTHGMVGTKTYKIWERIKARCNNPNSVGYKDYGGRGIKLCKRWHKFENFLDDMGEKPDNLSIERINNDGNYSPKNCKWDTTKNQSRNKRTSHLIDGKCIAEWAEIFNVKYNTLYSGITNHGWNWSKNRYDKRG